MNVMIACGGTGGHIFPGIAVGAELKERGHSVTLLVAGGKPESESVQGWDGAVVNAPALGFPSRFSLKTLRALLALACAASRCAALFMRRRPGLVLAMGGYGSVGPALAAKILRIPVVVHEANAVPGRAVSFLSRYAEAVAISFDGAARYLKHPAIAPTGFPVRKNIVVGKTSSASRGPFTLLVMGGSQGAHCLNRIVTEAVCRVNRAGVMMRVIHISGVADEGSVRRAYERAGIDHIVAHFVRDMGEIYAKADLAVCRAGAATCAELSACGLPALLVPLASAMLDHQSANARALQLAGGVDVISERELTVDRVAEYLETCAGDPGRLKIMSDRIRTWTNGDSTARLADLVERCARKGAE